jgi:hypothetical protein
MVDNLDKSDEFLFIGHQLGVVRADGAAKERKRSCALVQDDAEPGARGVAVDGERHGEVRELKN